MSRGQTLSINDRYRLAFAQGYNRAQDLSAEFRSTGSASLKNVPDWLLQSIFGYLPGSKVTEVNDERALTLAAVYACNRVLADSIASLPIGLYRITPDGDTQPADRRPEHRLVAITPSDLYTSYNFRSTGQFHLGLRGNFYARIRRDGRGGARELRILHPGCVRPFFDKNGDLWYEITPNPAMGYPPTGDKKEIIRPDDILHIPALSTDGVVGRSPLQVLRETIAIGLSNRDYVLQIHEQGGRVRGALKHPGKLGPEAVADLRENFVNAVNSGRFPMLENGVEFQAISLTPADAEFINTAKITTTDIARAYRIPPHIIGDLERATFSNIEHQSLEFVKHTLLPWIKNWEAELNRKLLPLDLQDTHFFRFNVEGLLRGDIRARMEAYTKAIQWGILNRDEVRELENRNRIPDGLGEIFLTPLNMAPLTEETIEGQANPDNQQTPDGNGTTEGESEGAANN